jgi:hypothetical protein
MKMGSACLDKQVNNWEINECSPRALGVKSFSRCWKRLRGGLKRQFPLSAEVELGFFRDYELYG